MPKAEGTTQPRRNLHQVPLLGINKRWRAVTKIKDTPQKIHKRPRRRTMRGFICISEHPVENPIGVGRFEWIQTTLNFKC